MTSLPATPSPALLAKTWGLAFLLWVGCLPAPVAFPPAPGHTVFGLVRDERGNPIPPAGAEVWLEAEGTVLLRTVVTTIGDTGANYRLMIPMDSGVAADLYHPSALRPTIPFRLRVRVGNTTYLPIVLQGAENLLTRPGESSRVDLTLGVDSDGDGLPDAWERALLQAGGLAGSLGDVHPKDDADGDGLTNLQEYLAGTYAFDPQDGFSLGIRSVAEGSAELEFTAIRGHQYTIEGSSDLTTWSRVAFFVASEGPQAQARSTYEANDVRVLRVSVAPTEDGDALPRFFRLLVH